MGMLATKRMASKAGPPMASDPPEHPASGGTPALSMVRAVLVLAAFVVAVGILVTVGTRPSVSGDALSPVTTTTIAAQHSATTTTTSTTIPHGSVTVLVANATSTSHLAQHYSTLLASGGWDMKTPTDAATTVAASAVYYAFGPASRGRGHGHPTGPQAGGRAAAHRGRAGGQRQRQRRGGCRRGRPGRGGRVGRAAPLLREIPKLFHPLLRHPERAALFLDFDGTLSAIVSEPVAARPLPGVPALLARLASMVGLVAVISGRPNSFLGQVLETPPGVLLVGLYGLELALEAEGQEAQAAAWADQIAGVVRDEWRLRRPRGPSSNPRA